MLSRLHDQEVEKSCYFKRKPAKVNRLRSLDLGEIFGLDCCGVYKHLVVVMAGFRIHGRSCSAHGSLVVQVSVHFYMFLY